MSTIGAEAANLDQLVPMLEPHFDINREVRIRHPPSGLDMRADLVLTPHDELVERRFPFDVLAIEGKRTDQEGRDRVASLRQCIDYAGCVIYDPKRLTTLSGCLLQAVLLYTGEQYLSPGSGTQDAQAAWHHTRDSDYGMLRLAAKFNVGLVMHDTDQAPAFVMAGDHLIWSPRRGTTGDGRSWPRYRRIGNSRRRVLDPAMEE